MVLDFCHKFLKPYIDSDGRRSPHVGGCLPALDAQSRRTHTVSAHMRVVHVYLCDACVVHICRAYLWKTLRSIGMTGFSLLIRTADDYISKANHYCYHYDQPDYGTA